MSENIDFSDIPETTSWDVAYQPYPEYPRGGQQTGASITGVKATCQRTGIIAISTAERAQFRNRKICDAMLKAGYAAMGIRAKVEG